VEDHHVDRPEVEAEQSVQLTGTNRSIGLDRRRFAKSAAPAEQTFRRKPSACSGKTLFPRTSRARGPDDLKTLPSHPSHYKCPHPRCLPEPLPGLNQGRASRGQGFAGLVAMARGQTPDPIPNSAVKTLSADGTAAQAAEE
jgi:hypothetical protein